MEYSDDSAICLASFHSGTLDPHGGNFVVKVGKALNEYETENRNGITSKAKKGDPAGKSISFEKMTDDSMDILNAAKEGIKVDIIDDTGKWLPGKVTKVNKNALKDIRVEVEFDGFPVEFNKKI